MKLRLNDASVRLRCRRSEVETFAQAGVLETITPFPNGRILRIALTISDGKSPSVLFTGDDLSVSVPREVARNWTATDEVGIYGHDGSLDILIEKDFRRTTLPSPDDADRYPNPRSPK
jgi:hypothetical protein